MKKKILTVAAIVICLAILSTGTLAYFTGADTTHNVITSGGVDIQLVEEMKNTEGNWVPFENQTGIMPGETVSKKVTVKSAADSAPSWIRVEVKTSSDQMKMDYNRSKWTEHEGFFYYNEILPANTETAPLFETVTFERTMNNAYQNAEFSISVVAEAVQSDNNIPTSGNPWDAGGWNQIQPLVRKLFN